MIRRVSRMSEPLFLLLLALLLAGGPVACLAAAEGADPPARDGEAGRAVVILPPSAQVDGGTVTLGDVARLEGPEELTRRLQAVTVGAAAPPGRSRWVETAYLAVRLRQAGIDPATVKLEGPDRVELVTAAPPAEPDAGRAAGEAGPAVARGETVVLEAVAGRVVVRVAARVLRPGRAGERVLVVNEASGREVEAVVVGPGQVRAEVPL
ncbi:flagella basal body P-ring formation protein FlgA [Limnochorda pilosa]|uniref:Flagella basal body P-ring formation protein FlgA SAF domain-containing protein n=1 Tax=Limnochorda pilosa TaxID=1555112 RepID=A0A0K2SPI1_LIMPI|nr:flagella basal body P-ring formation protein FlgA [Limnochorda pilosa]BAS28907.1 hypothetical protein LIP_3078 [Limnochorda pilosa]